MHRINKLALCILPVTAAAGLLAQSSTPAPWQDMALPTEHRAMLVLGVMTIEEKIAMLHGTGQPGQGSEPLEQQGTNGGAGFVVGVPRLGIPGLRMADAAYGVSNSGETGRYSTALPSNPGACGDVGPRRGPTLWRVDRS